jgi:hypothetical protein
LERSLQNLLNTDMCGSNSSLLERFLQFVEGKRANAGIYAPAPIEGFSVSEFQPALRYHPAGPADGDEGFGLAVRNGWRRFEAWRSPTARSGAPAGPRTAIAAALAFLAPDDANWVTDEPLRVAGGLGMQPAATSMRIRAITT